MKGTKRVAMSGVMFAALGFGAAGAADLPKEGSYDVTSCVAGTFSALRFSKGYVASTFEHTGTSRSNLPGGFGDGNTVHCLGVQSNIEGKIASTSFCESMDKDGDKIFSRSAGEDRKGTQETLAGTGKYEGIIRTGTGQPLIFSTAIKPGTYQRCDRLTGTYKLK